MAKKITQIEINGETYNVGGSGESVSGNFINQVDDFSQYVPTKWNEIAQYVGTDTPLYKNGYFYKNSGSWIIPVDTPQIAFQSISVGGEHSIPIVSPLYEGLSSPVFVGSNAYYGMLSINPTVGGKIFDFLTGTINTITAVTDNGDETYICVTDGGAREETTTYTLDMTKEFDYTERVDAYKNRFIVIEYTDISDYPSSMLGFYIVEETDPNTGTLVENYYPAGLNGCVVTRTTAPVVIDRGTWTRIDVQPTSSSGGSNALVGFILANNKVSIVPLVDCYIENGNLYDPTTHEQIYPTSDTYYYEINEEKVYTPDESYELVDVTSSVLIQPSVNQIVIEIRGNEAFRWDGLSYNRIVDSTKAPSDIIVKYLIIANNYAYPVTGTCIGTMVSLEPPAFYDKAERAMHQFTNDDNGHLFYDYTTNIVYMYFSHSGGYLYSVSENSLYYLENLDTGKLYLSYSTSKIYKTDNGTDFILIASNSYNDLSNKPLSVESSKVKYTLSDGTTKLTLAQESDLFSKDYNDLTSKPSKNYALGTNVPLITTEVGSKYYTFSSDLETGTQYKVIFDMIISSTLTFSTRNSIYIYVNQSFMWIVSSGTYQAGEYHIEKIVNVPNSFTNARIYLTANDSEFVGKVTVRNLRFENISENGWKPNISDEIVDFTSSAVSGNIASGETLAVMMKKIARVETVVFTPNSTNVQTSAIYCFLVGNIVVINGSFTLKQTGNGIIVGTFDRRLIGMTFLAFYNSNTSCLCGILYNDENGCTIRAYQAAVNYGYSFGCVTALYI